MTFLEVSGAIAGVLMICAVAVYTVTHPCQPDIGIYIGGMHMSGCK